MSSSSVGFFPGPNATSFRGGKRDEPFGFPLAALNEVEGFLSLWVDEVPDVKVGLEVAAMVDAEGLEGKEG